MQLEKWKRNDIFKAVSAGGLDPGDCSLVDEGKGVRLTHEPSGSYFLLEGDATQYTATMLVGDLSPWPFSGSWMSVPERVERWAREVKHEVDTPDLWAELQREREILTGVPYEDVENTPLTLDEQAEIAEQLRQIKEYVKETYALSEAQTRTLEVLLDEIQAAAGRIGRKDWLLLVSGAIFTVIVTSLLPPDAVQHIFARALHALSDLFGGLGGRPQLPPLP